ncbi:MAG: acyl carrier protein [Bacilli bacterium]|nr:acyl carrier protein [Bacilli bacterium]MBR4179043.1 acyl carrier protein [Bacilli bacterium]MBR4672121.1 acyl carrier protein [Bacilli bacterium]
MDKLIEILEELQPDVDYNTCEDLVDGRHLDSLTILSLISEIENEFDVEVPTVEIIPANFNSAKSIYALIEKLKEE